MKLEVPIKVDIDDVTKLIHDLQCLQTYKLGVNDTTVLVSLDAVVGVFADHIRAKRLGPDTNVASNSALDHIHNVVRDDAYRRGYEQGKKDAKAEAIPISWIKAYAEWLEIIPAPFAVIDAKSIRAMLTKWKTNPKLETPEAGCGKDACDL